MKIKDILPLIFLLIAVNANCQTSTTSPSANALKVIPSSPNVAALGKYGDIPVGYFTGIPNVSIPLYNIQVNHISQPISLSYHGGGIKVEEMASSVGLGWSLNANGMISRQVRGLPDEDGHGYMNNINTTYSATSLIDMIKQNYDSNPNALYDGSQGITLSTNQIDTEPDLYYFNFGNYSGKFFFDQTSGQFVCVSNKKIRIVYDTNVWTITTEDGTMYNFLAWEATNSINAPCSTFSRGYKTAWFLNKINSPSGADEIDFTYEDASYSYPTLSSETYYGLPSGTPPGAGTPPPFGPCGYSYIATSGVGTHRLKEITFPNGKVDFIYNQCRADLIGDKALNAIEVYQSNALLKRYVLNYDYFGNVDRSGNTDYCQVTSTNKDNSVNYRLKLASVATQGSDGITILPPYTFQYNENAIMPNRLSFDQDFLGYWNGPMGNSTLVPSGTYSGTSYSGADRSPNPTYAQACILTKMTYPTGGATSFQWEGNQLPNTGTVQGQLQSREQGISKQDLVIGQQVIKTFAINSQPDPSNGNPNGANVTYTYSFSGTCNSPFGSCVKVDICDMSNNIIFTMATDGSDTGPHYLANGNYQLKIRTAGNAQITSFSAMLNWKELVVSTQGNTITTAGLRINSITDQNTDGSSYSKYFRYESDDNTHTSSGYVAAPPAYAYGITFNGYFIAVRNSYTNYPLAATQGSYVYYNRVTALNGDATGILGKTVYTYSVVPDQLFNSDGDFLRGSFNATVVPFPPVISKDHVRGQLLDETIFQYQNGTFTPVKETINNYTTLPNLKTRGIKFMQTEWRTNLGPQSDGHLDIYTTQFYDTASDWISLTSTTEREYNPADGTKYVDVIQNYTYDPNTLQTTQINAVNSKGEQLITQYKYPGSFSDADGGPVVNDMKGSRFIQNAVLQKITSKTDNQGNAKLVSSQITQYNYTPGNTYVAPSEVDVLETSQTIDPANTITFPSYKPVNGYNSSLFQKRFSYYYDNSGNVIQQHPEKGNYVSYQWGYNNQYPVAQVMNANAKDIFYDSFEEGNGNSALNDSKTGHYSHVNTYSKILSGLDAGNYTLTYWQMVSGAWSFVKTLVTVSGSTYSINLNAQIDDVRFYPSTAQMTTYTYDPLIGMTSATDAKGMTTYYEYDGFQRLMNVKDKDGNIVKHYDYHYAKP